MLDALCATKPGAPHSVRESDSTDALDAHLLRSVLRLTRPGFPHAVGFGALGKPPIILPVGGPTSQRWGTDRITAPPNTPAIGFGPMRLRGLRAAAHLPQATARPGSPTPLAIAYGCAPLLATTRCMAALSRESSTRDTAPAQ